MSGVRTIEVHVELGIPQAFEIVSCRIEEGTSETTRARVEVAATEDLNLESVLTGDATIELLLDGFVTRRWGLKVGGARFLAAKSNGLRFAVELVSPEWIMTLTRDTRKYRKQTAKQIIESVLARSGVAHEWRTQRATPRRNYCVQYRETNYDFVRRLLEFEGIYYTFDEDGRMILADHSSGSPDVAGGSHFELLEGEGALTDGVVGIHELRRGARVRPGKFTVDDVNWKTPSTPLRQSSTASRDVPLEIYEYPSGFRNTGDGAYLAQIRLEARRVEARYVVGRSNVPGFAPMHKFTFGAATGATFAGEYLLTRLAHSYRNPVYPATTAATDVAHVYQNEVTAIPSDVPFRPAVVTPRPCIDGYHTAIVRGPAGQEIYTDKYGRFRVQFHWDREAKGTDEDSRWLRIAQESASSMFLPRIGWEVNVGYIDGDPDRPIGLARNINRVMPPAYGQPSKKNVMTIKTPTSPANGGYNEVRLDDSAGAQEFYVRAERDLLNLVKHDRTETIGQDETRSIGQVLQETVERDQRTTIGNDSTTTTGGMTEHRVNRNRKDTVGGDETIEVHAGMTLNVKHNESEKVGSVRSSKVDRSISRSGKQRMTRLVGGAQISTAQGNISTSANWGFTEIVGGAKITVAQEGTIQQSVAGPMATTVGGAVMRSSKADMSYSAENSFITVGATADMISDEKLKIESDGTIELEASQEMKLVVGGVSITLTPGEVRFTGDVHFKAKAKIAISGKPDNVTK